MYSIKSTLILLFDSVYDQYVLVIIKLSWDSDNLLKYVYTVYQYISVFHFNACFMLNWMVRIYTCLLKKYITPLPPSLQNNLVIMLFLREIGFT